MKLPSKPIFLFLIFCLYFGFLNGADSRVDLSNTISKLKLKGRAGAGYLYSGNRTSFPNGSFEVPEAKIIFVFDPSEKISSTIRFNINNGAANSPLVDYLFFSVKQVFQSFNLKAGRFKLGFGEETWSNNIVESSLTSNSAANTNITDEGIEISEKFFSFSATNGSSGVGSDTSSMKALMGKVFHSFCNNALFLSGSLYYSGSLKTSSSDMTIAGLIAPPTGSTTWNRGVVELNGRYDFKKGEKPLNPPVFSDSRAFVRASYGLFDDDATGALDREGHFGFVESLYNVDSNFFVAARASFIGLLHDATATLNSVTANHYERYSVGGGYRISNNIIAKAGYDINRNGGAGTEEVSDNLISLLLVAIF